jgi:hypothetical protein
MQIFHSSKKIPRFAAVFSRRRRLDVIQSSNHHFPNEGELRGGLLILGAPYPRADVSQPPTQGTWW